MAEPSGEWKEAVRNRNIRFSDRRIAFGEAKRQAKGLKLIAARLLERCCAAAIIVLFVFLNVNAVSAVPMTAASSVVVSIIDWRGWTNSIKISNGIVEAVVVPKIGRIMSFEYVGHPDTNPVFANNDPTLKAVSRPPGEWINYGGDKVWPSPQSGWPSYIGSNWPPDPEFDGEPQAVTKIKNGVILTTSVSAVFGLRSTRTIFMVPGDACLHISQTVQRIGAPKPATTATQPLATSESAIGIWNITEVNGDASIFLPVGSTNQSATGYVTFDPNQIPILSPPSLPTGWSRIDKILIGHRDPAASNKIGSCAPTRWVAALLPNNTLFSELYADQPNGNYPDGGCDSEVYCNGGATSYIELEVLGPLSSIRVGKQITNSVVWQLDRLPVTKTNYAALSQMIKQKMSKRTNSAD
jgi:hypothetical protein